jgi:hypothetical protein
VPDLTDRPQDRDPVRVFNHGTPDKPFVIPAGAIQSRSGSRPMFALPVVDPERVTDEIICRRFVLVDSKNRERVAIEQRPTGTIGFMIASRQNDAHLWIEVGDGEDGEDGYVLVSLSGSGRQSIVMTTDEDGAELTMEEASLNTPHVILTNAGLDIHRDYTVHDDLERSTR